MTKDKKNNLQIVEVPESEEKWGKKDEKKEIIAEIIIAKK